VASECRHLSHNTDTVGHKVQRRNLCGAMRPEQKHSCEVREFDSASAECEKTQSEIEFTCHRSRTPHSLSFPLPLLCVLPCKCNP